MDATESVRVVAGLLVSLVVLGVSVVQLHRRYPTPCHYVMMLVDWLFGFGTYLGPL